MLNQEQTEILEQAIFLLFRLRDEQSQENWEDKRSREFSRKIKREEEKDYKLKLIRERKQVFYNILSKRRNKIPMKLREIMNEQWLEDHTRQKENGCYEIRCSYNKIPVSASSLDLEIAVRKFLENLSAAAKPQSQFELKKKEIKTEPAPVPQIPFNVFAEKWYEVVKKPTVKEVTYISDIGIYKKHIKPYFEGMAIDKITSMQIQPLFNNLVSLGRCTQKVKLALNQIFKAAVAEHLITTNPMDGVRILKHHAKNGRALTYTEEVDFLAKLKASPYELTFILLLFCGMRRSELQSARIDGEFIIVQDGKKRLTDIKSERQIPITPMLKPHLANVSSESFAYAVGHTADFLSRTFKSLCPEHHLHELRHTFITRCQECSVPREVVSVWAGHAADNTMTSMVYTHFSREFMLSEAKKVDYYNRLRD